jgi:hypothetical protein
VCHTLRVQVLDGVCNRPRDLHSVGEGRLLCLCSSASSETKMSMGGDTSMGSYVYEWRPNNNRMDSIIASTQTCSRARPSRAWASAPHSATHASMLSVG